MEQELTYNLPELKFHVAALLRRQGGSEEIHSIEVELPFIDAPDDQCEPKPLGKLSGNVRLVRADRAIEVFFEDMNVFIEVTCFKCLKRFSKELKIAQASRSFYIDPKDIVYIDEMAIDPKTMELNANEALRQEIILHFPIVLVCFPGCKGTCELCCKDLNEGDCEHVNVPTDTNHKKPLSDLKDMWNNLNNQ